MYVLHTYVYIKIVWFLYFEHLRIVNSSCVRQSQVQVSSIHPKFDTNIRTHAHVHMCMYTLENDANVHTHVRLAITL